jgi:hypothetical protein
MSYSRHLLPVNAFQGFREYVAAELHWSKQASSLLGKQLTNKVEVCRLTQTFFDKCVERKFVLITSFVLVRVFRLFCDTALLEFFFCISAYPLQRTSTRVLYQT